MCCFRAHSVSDVVCWTDLLPVLKTICKPDVSSLRALYSRMLKSQMHKFLAFSTALGSGSVIYTRDHFLLSGSTSTKNSQQSQTPNELDRVVTVQVIGGQQWSLWSERLQMLSERFDLNSWLVFEFIWFPVLSLNQISACLALQGEGCPKLIVRKALSSLVYWK